MAGLPQQCQIMKTSWNIAKFETKISYHIWYQLENTWLIWWNSYYFLVFCNFNESMFYFYYINYIIENYSYLCLIVEFLRLNKSKNRNVPKPLHHKILNRPLEGTLAISVSLNHLQVLKCSDLLFTMLSNLS